MYLHVVFVNAGCVAGKGWTQMQDLNIRGKLRKAAFIAIVKSNTTNKKTEPELGIARKPQ